jgi:hypothetical protein
LTDGGGQVKGNRGQFPRFTAKYCDLPLFVALTRSAQEHGKQLYLPTFSLARESVRDSSD